MITTSLLLEWKAHPVTHKLFKLINEYISESTEALTSGAILNNNTEKRTAYYVGCIEALKYILNADLKDGEECANK